MIKHQESMHRLYEQQVKKNVNPEELALRQNVYFKRWKRWCTAVLSKTTLALFCAPCPSQTIQGLIKPAS